MVGDFDGGSCSATSMHGTQPPFPRGCGLLQNLGGKPILRGGTLDTCDWQRYGCDEQNVTRDYSDNRDSSSLRRSGDSAQSAYHSRRRQRSSCQRFNADMISFLIHYRGDKVRKFNEWQDDPPRYLDAFVNDDLQTLGLPPPHTCACTWRSGVMKCIWKAEEGRVCVNTR